MSLHEEEGDQGLSTEILNIEDQSRVAIPWRYIGYGALVGGASGIVLGIGGTLTIQHFHSENNPSVMTVTFECLNNLGLAGIYAHGVKQDGTLDQTNQGFLPHTWQQGEGITTTQYIVQPEDEGVQFSVGCGTQENGKDWTQSNSTGIIVKNLSGVVLAQCGLPPFKSGENGTVDGGCKIEQIQTESQLHPQVTPQF